MASEVVAHSVPSMLLLSTYRTMLSATTEFLVVGCLSGLLADLAVSKVESRDVTLSKKIWILLFCSILPLFITILERFMAELTKSLKGILDCRPGLHILLVRPWYRTVPVQYPVDLVQIQVMIL